jgi:hypothetical protein
MMKPLFESFKVMITSTTSDDFSQSVSNWVKEKLSLPKLRIGNTLIHLSLELKGAFLITHCPHVCNLSTQLLHDHWTNFKQFVERHHLVKEI